jgi:aerobic carbon-monoxide dehydrogenase medium subunit
MRPLPYHQPGTVQEALGLARSLPGSRFVAGGTDLLVRLKSGAHRPSALISLRGIAELTGTDIGEMARLGAATTVAELLDNEDLMTGWPVLGDAMGEMASPQIRSSATLGGNLCNAAPCADSAPALLVLRARVGIRGKDGDKVMALEDFFKDAGITQLGAGELLTHLEVDRPAEGLHAIFLKKKRVAMDLAIASVAGALRLQDGVCAEVRFAAGSVAPVPMRLLKTENVLRGEAPTDALIKEARRVAEQEVIPITDIRGGAEYRRTIVGVYVERAMKALVALCEGGE